MEFIQNLAGNSKNGTGRIILNLTNCVRNSKEVADIHHCSVDCVNLQWLALTNQRALSQPEAV
jgi:hypothetical protein